MWITKSSSTAGQETRGARSGSEKAPSASGPLSRGLLLATVLLALAVLPLRAETLVTLGLHNGLPETKKYRDWRDLRLGLGIRGRLAQMAADTGSFAQLEDRQLAASVREAVGGYWLEEPAEARDPGGFRRAAGASWVLYGNLNHVGVTRDRVSGPIGRASWRYRVRLTVCLEGDLVGEICQDGEGRSKTAKTAVGFNYRGDDLAWDQAGPTEAVNQALDVAFAGLWRRVSPRLSRRGEALAGKGLQATWNGQPLPVYVAGFGLSSTVARAYPELAESRVGWGLCQRIVESLYDSGRFKFVEEKAEVVQQLARLMRNPSLNEEAVEQGAGDVEWLLYGEVVDLQVARREKIAQGGAELETRITIQTRLVERDSRRVLPATGTGVHIGRLTGWKGGRPIDDLDERGIGLATDAAVIDAVGKLLQSLR